MIEPIVSPPLAVRFSLALSSHRHSRRKWTFPFSIHDQSLGMAIARAALRTKAVRRSGRAYGQIYMFIVKAAT
ncbi:hypothetical protein [Geobacillus jurassicus]|uniref:Uncharacterized protein n=1 Tax=Geobacillus jurassicus TaxID=235932 RepID=A0ABV6GSZ0_9BACL|nr:hypothetical protein [Geobacillus jurassicus]